MTSSRKVIDVAEVLAHYRAVEPNTRPDFEQIISKYKEWEQVSLPVKQLKLDDGYDPSKADRYAKRKTTPPAIVAVPLDFQWDVLDGNHRSAAAQAAGKRSIKAFVPVRTRMALEMRRKQWGIDGLAATEAPQRSRKWLWIGGGVALLAGLAYWQRQNISKGVTIVTDVAKKTVFPMVLPAHARPYADVMLRVADEQGVSPYLIAGLMDRETRYGTAPGYYPKGPSGKGDGGHGHGLMQIDDRSHTEFLAKRLPDGRYAWEDPYENVTYAIGVVWKGARKFFASRQSVKNLTTGTTVTVGSKGAAARGVSPGAYSDPRPLSGDALDRAATAAYNTGAGNVLISLAVGLDPDFTTADSSDPDKAGDYSADVLGKLAALLAAAERLVGTNNEGAA